MGSIEPYVLGLLAEPGAGGQEWYLHRFPETAAARYSGSPKPDQLEIKETLWSLIAKRLVYLDVPRDGRTQFWALRLTGAGQAAAQDDRFNPIAVDSYVAALRKAEDDLGDLVSLYLRESLECFSACQYLASAVMLGVATEAAFLDMAKSASVWLGPAGKKLEGILADPQKSFNQKVQQTYKRLQSHKQELPHELRGGLEVPQQTVLHLIRVNRNESGHPTGVGMERSDQQNSLRLFPSYCSSVYRLRRFFSGTRGS